MDIQTRSENESLDTKTDIFSYEKKAKQAEKIRSLGDKNKLKKIWHIIKNNNPQINYKQSSDGILMFYQNCTNDTYIEIDNILNSKTNNLQSIQQSSEQFNSSDADYSKDRTRLRYSNKERKLIKRQEYENVIQTSTKAVVIQTKKTPKSTIFSKG